MEHEVVWTNNAVSGLKQLFQNVASTSPTAANQLMDSILNRVERLKGLPHSGQSVIREKTADTRQIVHAKYQVYYNVLPDRKRVEIVSVWPGVFRND